MKDFKITTCKVNGKYRVEATYMGKLFPAGNGLFAEWDDPTPAQITAKIARDVQKRADKMDSRDIGVLYSSFGIGIYYDGDGVEDDKDGYEFYDFDDESTIYDVGIGGNFLKNFLREIDTLQAARAQHKH